MTYETIVTKDNKKLRRITGAMAKKLFNQGKVIYIAPISNTELLSAFCNDGLTFQAASDIQKTFCNYKNGYRLTFYLETM